MLHTVGLWYRTWQMRHDGLIPSFCRVIGRGIAKCHDCDGRRMCDVIELDPDYCPNRTAQYVALCIECSSVRGTCLKDLWKSS